MHLRDGGVMEERVAVNRGGPGNSLSREELAAKFRMNAGERVDASAVIAEVAAPGSRSCWDGRDAPTRGRFRRSEHPSGQPWGPPPQYVVASPPAVLPPVL
nr:hypothetical protein [Kutzneria buriramensis]